MRGEREPIEFMRGVLRGRVKNLAQRVMGAPGGFCYSTEDAMLKLLAATGLGIVLFFVGMLALMMFLAWMFPGRGDMPSRRVSFTLKHPQESVPMPVGMGLSRHAKHGEVTSVYPPEGFLLALKDGSKRWVKVQVDAASKPAIARIFTSRDRVQWDVTETFLDMIGPYDIPCHHGVVVTLHDGY